VLPQTKAHIASLLCQIGKIWQNLEDDMMRHYYLRQRSEGGKWYAMFVNTITKKHINQRCTGTYDREQADLIAQNWVFNGLPDSNKASKGVLHLRNTPFCDYLYNTWDFEKSECIKEKITLGKHPNKSHPKDMQRIVNTYFKPYFNKMLLCEITEEKINEFLVYLRTEKEKVRMQNKEVIKGLSSSTVKKVKNAAVVPLRFAKRKKIIRNFDFDAVIKPDGEQSERGILSPDQMNALFNLKWRSKKAYLICKIASQIVARLGEILALSISAIHEDQIDIQYNWNKDVGLKSTKNRENRSIPIMPELYNEILVYISEEKLTLGSNELLFPGKNKEKPYSQKQVEKEFYLMLEKIGISDKKRRDLNIVFHSFRHYGAKHLAENTDRITGMAILGHKTPNLYDKYSNHADNETFAKMKKAIRDSFGKKNFNNIEPIPFPKVVNYNQEGKASSG
jgi:integrase